MCLSSLPRQELPLDLGAGHPPKRQPSARSRPTPASVTAEKQASLCRVSSSGIGGTQLRKWTQGCDP